MKGSPIKRLKLGNNEISVIANSPNVDFRSRAALLINLKVLNPILFSLLKKWFLSKSRKNGIHMLFERQLKKSLLGDSSWLEQQVLLLSIPSFATAEDFIKRPVIQWIVKRISNLVFVLTAGYYDRLDQGRSHFEPRELSMDKLKFLVHAYSGEPDAIKDLCYKVTQKGIMIHFVGKRSALIGESSGGHLKTLPCPINGLLIFAGFEERDFIDLIKENFYREFIHSNEENSIGLF